MRANGAWEVRLAQTAAGARADLEGAEGGVRGDGAHLAELHRAGRRDSAHRAAGGAGGDRAGWRRR